MEKKKIHIENLKRKNIHKVPDGYFEKLPLEIKQKIDLKKKPSGIIPQLSYAIKWGIPAIAMVIIGFFFFTNQQETTGSAEELIAEVNTEDLVAYLESSDISTEEILNSTDFSGIDLEFDDSDADIFEGLDIDNEDLDLILSDFDNDI